MSRVSTSDAGEYRAVADNSQTCLCRRETAATSSGLQMVSARRMVSTVTWQHNAASPSSQILCTRASPLTRNDCCPANYCFSVLCDGGIATMSSILNSTSHKPSLSPLSPLKTLHNDCHDPGIEAKQCASQHARVGFAQSIIYRGFICAHTQSFRQCTHTGLCLIVLHTQPTLLQSHKQHTRPTVAAVSRHTARCENHHTRMHSCN